MLAGGHAENALPQSATATVNCRVFPGVEAADVQRTLERLVADTTITVTLTGRPVASPASPLRPDVTSRIEQLAAEFWPNSVMIPHMSNGATDGLFLRNIGIPVYGVSGILMDPEDDRSHGLDERVPVRSLYQSREFWYRLVKSLTGAAARTM
jgi:acetylornithine deacetylase/succinyl-diaminopimelate desuccinylase-like protein